MKDRPLPKDKAGNPTDDSAKVDWSKAKPEEVANLWLGSMAKSNAERKATKLQ